MVLERAVNNQRSPAKASRAWRGGGFSDACRWEDDDARVRLRGAAGKTEARRSVEA